jgi:tetratricopeptide (TPR) repeat protein
MLPFWKRVGDRPETTGLEPSVAAEVLLCVGVLTRWIGSKNQIKESETASRDLISESITFYESVGDTRKVAEARSELAYCYWRAGELDEARIMFGEALQKLATEGNTRANALLGLSVVEWAASRYNESLRILTDNAPLFKKIANHTTKGFYHNTLAMVLRKLARSENRLDYFRRAVSEYHQADDQFRLAQNISFRADVKNNVGNLLRELRRFKEAHKYLEEARRLAVGIRDSVLVAQFDDSRATLLIAQKRPAEAEPIARNSVRVLERSGYQCLLADSLITHGIALARLGKREQAQFTFQRAMEIGRQGGALNKAGLAALTLIEEINQLPPEVLSAAYEQAGEWLAACQSQDVWLRFTEAGRKLARQLRAERSGDEATSELLANRSCYMPEEVLKFEGRLISQALAKVDGRITHAAKLLGIGRQRLAYILETRHKELFQERTPVRRRGKSQLAKPVR